MKKSIEPKRKNVNKLAPGWQLVTVRISAEALAIARAIALVRTQEGLVAAPPGGPWTLEQIAEGALEDGLVAAEKEFLGTRSLDRNEPEPGEESLPEETPAMRALVQLAAAGQHRSAR